MWPPVAALTATTNVMGAAPTYTSQSDRCCFGQTIWSMSLSGMYGDHRKNLSAGSKDEVAILSRKCTGPWPCELPEASCPLVLWQRQATILTLPMVSRACVFFIAAVTRNRSKRVGSHMIRTFRTAAIYTASRKPLKKPLVSMCEVNSFCRADRRFESVMMSVSGRNVI